MSDLAIRTTNLTKSYGRTTGRKTSRTTVLDGIDLSVAAGEVFALLGPNGAGKTTTVNILSTLQHPDGGSAEIFGLAVVSQAGAVRPLIGLTGQFSAVDGLLTGRENLALVAALAHLPKSEQRARVEELLERFDLGQAAAKQVSTYSGGMRRRLDLAMTLIARPRLVFLDEPTTGLDPRSRRTMWDIVSELVAAGVTIFLTTQYLDEADALADRIAVLDGGRIVADDTPAGLKRLVPGARVDLAFASASDLDRATGLWPGAHARPESLTLSVPGDGGAAHLRQILGGLESAGIEPSGLAVETPSLDDVFFALTGHGAGPVEPAGTPGTGEPDAPAGAAAPADTADPEADQGRSTDAGGRLGGGPPTSISTPDTTRKDTER